MRTLLFLIFTVFTLAPVDLLAAVPVQGSGFVSTADSLTRARAAIDRGDLIEAKLRYAEISFTDSNWVEKSEDALRKMLIDGHPEASWRVAMLLKRVGKPVADLDYYAKLAALLAGACPLGEATEPESFDDLVKAYAARYYQKYSGARPELQNPMERASDGRDIASFNVTQVPFLSDLGRVKLVRGSGCRFYRGDITTRAEAEEAELRHLLTYVKRIMKDGVSRPQNDERVYVRLLELATRLNYTDLSSNLIRILAPIETKVWLQLTESDRRFLWSTLQINEKVPASTVAVGSKEDELIGAIILKTSDADVTKWLALVDFDHWSRARREKLYDYLDRLPVFIGKGQILIRRALLAYERGQIKESLAFLRRILVTHDDVDINAQVAVDDTSLEEVQGMALRLVQEILSRYQYDQTILAVVQSTVLPTEWRRIYRSLLLEHALVGDVESYRRLKNDLVAHGFKKTGPRLSDDSIQVLDAMAARKIKDLSQLAAAWNRLSHGEFRRMMRDLAIHVSALSDDDFRKAKGVLAVFLPILEAEKGRGKDLQVTTDFIRTFSRGDISGKEAVGASIEGGVTHAGSANLRPVLVLKNPFQWVSLDRLPLQPLLAMPEQSTNRTWTIK